MPGNEKAFFHSPSLDRFSYPDDCPFNSHRAEHTRRILDSFGLLTGEGRRRVEPATATRTELLRLHSPRYLDVLQRASQGQVDEAWLEMGLGTPDTPAFLGMYDYAALACGASLEGARLILSGQASLAFNPSGGYHHAHPERAGGFCYLNDVALACLELARAGRRVLFLDLDVHHCDGVQNVFYHRRDVMTLSLHESGLTLFPGTGFENEIGDGDGRGYTVNVPLPQGMYDEAYLRAFDALALPLIDAFDPDILVVEWGMDVLSGDPLAHFRLSNNAPAAIARKLRSFDKPILATGGGGYQVGNTARGWALVWSVLVGAEPDADLAAGLGGVMLGSADWLGGLRDSPSFFSEEERRPVDSEVNRVVESVKRLVFPIHGL